MPECPSSVEETADGERKEGIGRPNRVKLFASDHVPDKTKMAFISDLPNFEQYKADPYLVVASALQAEGKEKAKLIMADPAGLGEDKNGLKVILLCRMLFLAKPKGDFRSPLLGLPIFVGPTKSDEWPCEPLDIVDGVPFLIVKSYRLDGLPESSIHYLDYCIKCCDWNQEMFKPKSAQEKQKAMSELLANHRWEKLLTEEQRKVLSSQIE
jgi:hypothetical protein